MTLPRALADARTSKDPTAVAELLALRELSMPELVAKYQEVYGRPARVKHREYLLKRVGWRLQERRTGGLSTVAKARLEALIAELGPLFGPETRTTSGRLVRPPKPGAPAPGATFVREWRGQRISVHVDADGACIWEGRPFKSLSAAACAITGSHVSGPAWFGLTKRKEPAA